MAKRITTKIGTRDIEILTAIDRCPLTVAQLCELSETFTSQLTNADNLRRRLRQLAGAGFVSSFPYCIAGDGRSPRYFKLTKDGYRLIYGQDAVFPRRRYFTEISPGHHHHTYCLAQTIVWLCITASRNGCEVLHFARENSVRLVAESIVLSRYKATHLREQQNQAANQPDH
ncbi:replication-relaxation family protein [bacterium]|nr:replication-relaxation family protein [bacterium]